MWKESQFIVNGKHPQIRNTGFKIFRMLIAAAFPMFVLTACSLSSLFNSSGPGVTAVPLTPVPAAGGACANPLYPVAPTVLWNYHVTGSPTGDFDYFSIIRSVGADNFQEDSHFGDLVRSAVWQCNPTGLAVLAPGGGISGAIDTPNTSAVYTTTNSTGDTLPKTVNAGDTWTQTLTIHGEQTLSHGTVLPSDGTYTSYFTAAGMESVEVPAGTFNAMRVDVESHWDITTTVEGITVPVHLNITSTVWYATGIGPVKTVVIVGDITTTVVLTSYSLP